MSKKVYLVRHGETEDLAKKLHQQNDSVLSERGNQQAQDVAGRFSKIRADIVYSSPFLRTLQTAKHIGTIAGAPVETKELLRERKQPKEIMGKPRDDAEVMRIKNTINEHRHDPSWHYSDEENFFDLRGRVKEFQKFVENDTQENVVLVSHAVFIKMFTLVSVFGDLLTPDMFSSYYQHVRTSQTGITMLEFTDNEWKLLTWNDYAHLGENT
ncbi:MAG: histidine phosphatase family protein [Patescibacteria group bacterium]